MLFWIIFGLFVICITTACLIWFVKGGLASKIFTAPVLMSVAFGLAWLAWNGVESTYEDHSELNFIHAKLNEVKASESKKALLKDVIPFEWIAMCPLHPYGGYNYEYPPSEQAVNFFMALGAKGFEFENDDDGDSKYLFRTVDGEIKNFYAVFDDVWEFESSTTQSLPCYFSEDTYIMYLK